MGNPCTEWTHYRQFVVGTLPQLQKLDGEAIRPSQRIAAQQVLPKLQQRLEDDVRAAGLDAVEEARVEDDGVDVEYGEIEETGYVDDNGEIRRPWCPETRILDHREMEQQTREAQRKPRERHFLDGPAPPERRDDFPDLPDPDSMLQRNEGEWEFAVDLDPAGKSVLLVVELGKYLDTSNVKVDVQPKVVRLLIKGRLLQLRLPCEVKPDSSSAQRSTITGALVIRMPRDETDSSLPNIAYMKPSPATANVLSELSPNKTSTPRDSRATAGVQQLKGGPQKATARKQQASSGQRIGMTELFQAKVEHIYRDDSDDDLPSL